MRQFVINHPSQLNSLSTLPFSRRTGIGKIVFNESFLHPDKEKWQQKLNREYYACGCSEGAKALLIGLFIFLMVGVIGFFYSNWSLSKSVTVIFVGTIAMSVLGKLIGLVKANKKLRATIQEIQSVWQPEWPQGEIIGCG